MGDGPVVYPPKSSTTSRGLGVRLVQDVAERMAEAVKGSPWRCDRSGRRPVEPGVAG